MTEQVQRLNGVGKIHALPVINSASADSENITSDAHLETSGVLNTDNISARSFEVEYEGDDVDQTPKKWVDDDMFLTHLLNGYSLFIPDGEKINCICVKPHVKNIKSTELQQRARGLLAQEATHGVAHTKFLDMLDAQGYNTKIFLTIYQFLAYKIMLPLFPKTARLAFVTAIERINELLGEITLKSKMLHNSSEPAAKLYKWHFAEEIEHKCVVFDVYHDISGNKWLLAYGTILCYITYMSLIFFSTLNFMVQDGSILNPKNWVRGFRFMFTKEKAFWVITQGCIALIKRDFHPSQRKNLYLAEAVLKSKVIS